jgi:hypothetical protein
MPNISNVGTNAALGSDLTGGTPTDGDNLYVGFTSLAYTSGDLTSIDYSNVFLMPDFTGNPTTALKFVCNRTSTGKLHVLWGGSALQIESSSVTGVIYYIFHAPSAGGTVNYSNLDTEYFAAKTGVAVLEATADVENLTAYGNTRVVVPYANGSYQLTSAIILENADVELDRDVVTLTVAGNVPPRILKNVTPTTLNLFTQVDYRGGNIGTLVSYGGAVLDLRRITTPITITDIQNHGDLRILLKVGQTAPTVSGNTVAKGSIVYEYSAA